MVSAGRNIAMSTMTVQSNIHILVTDATCVMLPDKSLIMEVLHTCRPCGPKRRRQMIPLRGPDDELTS